MKTYFFIILILLGFTVQANAQTDPVERTKQKAKNKTNNRIDNKIDNKLDEGLDALEGLFKRKKKKKKKKEEEEKEDNNSDNNSNQSTQTRSENDGTGFLNKMLGGEGNIEVKSSYTFNMSDIYKI
ncbi:MAG: hypothetical protein COZ18_06540 [Flexibacter sp. CG_4_10_14_3_um_filter_32_15]|nr:MAG: hypothetical protein COZ18_06540 [Flexibacter sp. CG_4_10_14_3_um_filter_32_15]